MSSKLSLDAIFHSLKKGDWLSANLHPKEVRIGTLAKTRTWAEKLIGFGENYRLSSVAQAVMQEIQIQPPQSPEQVAQTRDILSCIEKKAACDSHVQRVLGPQIASIRQLLSRQIGQ